jgi:hypothetical protein
MCWVTRKGKSIISRCQFSGDEGRLGLGFITAGFMFYYESPSFNINFITMVLSFSEIFVARKLAPQRSL